MEEFVKVAMLSLRAGEEQSEWALWATALWKSELCLREVGVGSW